MHDKFWSHVERRTKRQVQPRFLVKLLGEAKVGDFDLEVFRVLWFEKNIFWLHIPMSNLLEMQIVQTKHCLVDDVRGLHFCEAGDLWKPVKKFTALDEFGNDIIVTFILNKINNAYNVWVRFLS